MEGKELSRTSEGVLESPRNVNGGEGSEHLVQCPEKKNRHSEEEQNLESKAPRDGLIDGQEKCPSSTSQHDAATRSAELEKCYQAAEKIEADDKQMTIVNMNNSLLTLPLPAGWIGLPHENGAYIYVHQATRVVCCSRPYMVGKATSLRRHAVPAFAIPCLYQKIQKKRDRKQKLAKWRDQLASVSSNEKQESSEGTVESHASSAAEFDKKNETESNEQDIELVPSQEIREYLQKGFDFVPISTYDWKRQTIRGVDDPDVVVIPDALKGIPEIVDVTMQGECKWKTSAAGKSAVMLLNEYCQRFKTVPKYKEVTSVNTTDGFAIEVTIDGVKFGTGRGTSKKVAKHQAAEQALAVLLPGQYKAAAKFEVSNEHLKIFDTMSITDENVYPYVSKLNLATPCKILQMCFDRHHGNDNMPTEYTFRKTGVDGHNLSFEMTCGDFKVQGSYRTKNLAKQVCAQKVLQHLHPHINMWGSIMRLYTGTNSKIVFQPKNEDGYRKLGITDKKRNENVLEALKKEMRALSYKVDHSYQEYPRAVKRLKMDETTETTTEKKKIATPQVSRCFGYEAPPPKRPVTAEKYVDEEVDF